MPNGTLFCSFCAKSAQEVRKLIAGPGPFICNECVELCMDILAGPAPISGEAEYLSWFPSGDAEYLSWVEPSPRKRLLW